MLTFPAMDKTPEIIERYYELITARDPQALAKLYADDAEIIRYDGVAWGTAEIEQYYRNYITVRPGMVLRQIDKVRDTGEVLMWDALVESDAGVMQTLEVFILDDEGLIRRHIPGVRGYWGR